MKLGGQGVGSAISDTPRILRASLQLPMQLVEGYTGTSTMRLAMDSGEVDGMCGWGWESIKTTAYDKIKSADLRVVLQSSLERHPEIKDVPTAMEYAKDERARKLIEVDAYNHGTLERVFSLPPGVPEQRLRVLQKAFMIPGMIPSCVKKPKRRSLRSAPLMVRR